MCYSVASGPLQGIFLDWKVYSTNFLLLECTSLLCCSVSQQRIIGKDWESNFPRVIRQQMVGEHVLLDLEQYILLTFTFAYHFHFHLRQHMLGEHILCLQQDILFTFTSAHHFHFPLRQHFDYCHGFHFHSAMQSGNRWWESTFLAFSKIFYSLSLLLLPPLSLPLLS